MSADVKISYVIASRNDSYGGDSLGRLQKTLNHTGYILGRKGALSRSEVLVTDWATPKNYRPLKESLCLNEDIKSILKIIEVPPRIANRYQLNSPFSEVHALNTAFRKSTGTFFGRIDQDTLIGDRFIDWFYWHFHEQDLGFSWPLVAFSGRRNLDQEQSKQPYNFIFDKEKYKEVKICHSNNFYSRIHPTKQQMLLFFGGAVGILLIHRDLYIKHKGYNESYIYMNNMETEFLNRLKHDRNDFYNLGLKCDGDFYHLHHSRKDGAKEDSQLHAKESGSRKTNPPLMREAEPYNPNTDMWGLKNENLNVFSFTES